MGADTRIYSFDKVEFNWATLDMKEGAAEGSALQEAKGTPRNSMKKTGMGGIVVTFHPDRSGVLSYTCDPESETQQQLWDIALAHDVTRNQFYPGTLTDISTGEITTYINMFILETPDEGRGTESGTNVWQLGYERKVKQTGSGIANIAGT